MWITSCKKPSDSVRILPKHANSNNLCRAEQQLTLQKEAPKEKFNSSENDFSDSFCPTLYSLSISISKRVYNNNQWHRIGKKSRTLSASAMAIPTIKRKNGITKSARLQPFHGAWPITGHSSPASSTNIINWTPICIHRYFQFHDSTLILFPISWLS